MSNKQMMIDRVINPREWAARISMDTGMPVKTITRNIGEMVDLLKQTYPGAARKLCTDASGCALDDLPPQHVAIMEELSWWKIAEMVLRRQHQLNADSGEWVNHYPLNHETLRPRRREPEVPPWLDDLVEKIAKPNG